MRVLFVASECAPLVKTGGLADVIGALAPALRPLDVDVRILLPGYPAVLAALDKGQERQPLGDGAALVAGTAAGLDLVVLDNPSLYDRPGNPYLGPDGLDWPDNHRRFGALSRAAAAVAAGGASGWRPDLVHAHDWQAGLVPTMIRQAGSAVPSVFTIHNIAFQGLFPPEIIADLDLPRAEFRPDGYEYWGRVGFLKAALVNADWITTVSPTYARELAWPEYGRGLEGVIASRRDRLTGILNGIDEDAWDPAGDRHLVQPYSARNLNPKRANRRALIERYRLTPGEGPIFAVVSRMSEQKGLDLLAAALPRLIARDGRLALLGDGEAELVGAFRDAAAAWPGRVGMISGWDEALAHRLIAGADAILLPSRFEPCGLTQLYGLRYATIPVVARTGGLADTVIDHNEAAIAVECSTGFVHAPDSVRALADAIDRACDAFADPPVWGGLMARAIQHPVGWQESALEYVDLYRSIMEEGA